MNFTIRNALISSWRKEAAVELARELAALDITIYSSGGTAKTIAASGIPVNAVAGLTGFDELLGGRVKTLHPAVFAGILARRSEGGDLDELKALSLPPFDLVAVDAYPFPDGDASVDFENAIELIDIGGISLIRAAAKNHNDVLIAYSADVFGEVANHLRGSNGVCSGEFARRLAAQAFRFTADYDARIAEWLAAHAGESSFPRIKCLALVRDIDLRYGENPHQNAAFYRFSGIAPVGVAAAKVLGGKQLSFNNLLDLDIALRLPREFDLPAAAILKHTTPCGVGLGADPAEAFAAARKTDPQSAFGGIVGFNRPVDLPTAKLVREGFMEVIAAPDFDDDALAELKRSKNLRIVVMNAEMPSSEMDVRSVGGGLLVQQFDRGFPELNEINVVTKRHPSESELNGLKFLWRVGRWVKSNAIVIGNERMTLGIGAGQMSRVDAARIAVDKASREGHSLSGAMAASDAFFPFRDGLDILADAGVTAVIQPGGSVRDGEVIAAADERGIAMVFTGRRHFRH